MYSKKEIDDRTFRYLQVLYRELRQKLKHKLYSERGICSFLDSKKSCEAVGEIINEEMERDLPYNPSRKLGINTDFFMNFSSIGKGEKPKQTPRISSLEKLVSFLGYKNWDTFKSEIDKRLQLGINHQQDELLLPEFKTCSKYSFFDPNEIIVDNLVEGQEVTIGWYDSYYVRAIYEGEYKFKIIDASDTVNRKPNDIFYAEGFEIVYMWHCIEINGELVSGYPRLPYIRIIPPSKNRNKDI